MNDEDFVNQTLGYLELVMNELLIEAEKHIKNIYITGHSLAGGLSQYIYNKLNLKDIKIKIL